MKLLALKLVTGEEIIGQVATTPEGRLAVTKAVMLRMFPSKIAGGQPSMGFTPFPSLADHNVVSTVLLEPLHVVYTYAPDPELATEYTRMYDEGLNPQQIITG